MVSPWLPTPSRFARAPPIPSPPRPFGPVLRGADPWGRGGGRRNLFPWGEIWPIVIMIKLIKINIAPLLRGPGLLLHSLRGGAPFQRGGVGFHHNPPQMGWILRVQSGRGFPPGLASSKWGWPRGVEGNPIQRRGWWEGLERGPFNWCPLWYCIGNSPSMERVIILSPATSAYRGGSVSGGNLSTNPSGQGWLLRSNPLPGGYFGESQPKEEVRGRLINGERIIKGAKVGYNMETLPFSVNSFNMNPIVRICRVIGGLSIVIWLGYYKKLDYPFNYLIFLLASIQFIYMFIILTIKVGVPTYN